MVNPLEFGAVTESRQADKLSKWWSNTSDFKLHKEQEHPLLHPPAEHLQIAAQHQAGNAPFPSPGEKQDNLLYLFSQVPAPVFPEENTCGKAGCKSAEGAASLPTAAAGVQRQQADPALVKPQIKND